MAEEEFKRFEFQPIGGFTVSGGVPLRADDDLDHGSVHVDSSYHLGGNFGVYLNELDSVELHWQRQFTNGRLPRDFPIPAPAARSTGFNLKIDQFHGNFIHHYRIADPKARPFVMVALGVTRYSADASGESHSNSHFSFSISGGVKYFMTNHFGFRGEARWSPTVLSSSGSKTWCEVAGGATCRLGLRASAQQQLDLTGGLVFRF